MSTFSDTILAHKYLNKDLGETSWDDVARRVAWEVVGKNYPRAYKEVYEIIKDKKFIPGGRYLYAAGRPYHQTQNCFAAETRVPFYENSQFCVKTAPIKDLVGKPDLVIMTTGGTWTQAEIKSFGVQKLSKITLQRQINIYMISDGGTLETYEERVIYATPGHSWRVRAVNTDTKEVKKQEVQTKHLKPKMELWDVYDRAHRWTVISVEKTDREEEVFCAVVENTHEFVIEGDILTGNCLLLDVEDTRQAWADLSRRSVEGLSTGAGIGVVYSKIRPNGSPIRGMGGKATGPIALMQMINELGRHIQQGGSRRSALWAGLHWNHADVHDFIALKNWIPEVRALKEQDFNFPAPMDGTNISVILDDDFFKAYHDTNNPQHVHAHDVHKKVVKSMLKTGEPGYSVDVGKNAGEHLRNAPVTADTYVLTKQGYKKVRDIVNTPTELWTGKQWAVATFTKTGENVPVVRVEMTGGRVIRCDPSHEFFVNVFSLENARRKFSDVMKVRAQDLEPDMVLHTSLPPVHNEQQVDRDAYTLGYLYADGVFTKNSAYVHVPCNTDAAARLYTNLLVSSRYKSAKVINEGGLAKVIYKSDKEYWSGRKKTIFPEEVYTYNTNQIVSFLAGLFDGAGVFNADQARVRLVSKDKTFLRSIARLLEQVGIFAGVGKSGYSKTGMQRWCLNIMHDYLSAFVTTIPCQIFKPDVSEYESYRASDIRVLSVTEDGAEDVFCCDVGVPEHSFMAEGVIISNCTEVTSADDNDIC